MAAGLDHFYIFFCFMYTLFFIFALKVNRKKATAAMETLIIRNEQFFFHKGHALHTRYTVVNISRNGPCSRFQPLVSAFSLISYCNVVYFRVYVFGFLLLVGPFTFFNVTKTKHLQMFTTILRYYDIQICNFLKRRCKNKISMVILTV